MKGKLYLKIFLSFMAVLVITMLVIMVLFFATAGREFHLRFKQLAKAQALHLRLVVGDKIGAESDTPISGNKALESYLTEVSAMFKAKIWVEDKQGNVLAKGFTQAVPPEAIQALNSEPEYLGELVVYEPQDIEGWAALAIIPLRLKLSGQEERQVLIKVFIHMPKARGPEEPFGFGLVIITALVALLVIPVSRLITRPLKRLQISALRVADGDLSHRATVSTRDEIGDLGRALNHMTDSLERQIRGGKELTANVSHELRTPLARLRVAQELLRDKLSPRDLELLAPRLDAMELDIEELDRLIGRILELSKLDIADQPLRLESFDLAGFLDGILERYGPSLEQKGLTLERDYRCGEYSCLVRADQELLGSALSNLVDNAVKYAVQGGAVRARVSVFNVEGASEGQAPRVELALAESHAPLAEEDLGRIFEPFYRVGGKPGGNGLGLAIAKRIVERHGGSIKARNTDLGLEICISLALVAE